MRRSMGVFVAAVTALTAFTTTARAEVVNQCSFDAVEGFSLNGEGFLEGGRVILTDAMDADHSTVFWETPVTWYDGASFAARLRFQIRGGPAEDRGAGDGLAFVLHSDQGGAQAIHGGGTQGTASLTPAVVVRFDTLRNYDNDDPGAEDASDNQIEVAGAGGGGTSFESIDPSPVDLDGVTEVTAEIAYDAAAGALTVTIGGSAAATASIDPDAYFMDGDSVWFGVTAFGSSAHAPPNRHELIEFQFATEGTPCGCGVSCGEGLVCEGGVCVPSSPATGGEMDEPEGCSCRADAPVPTGPWALVGLLGWIARRRR